MRKDGGPGCGEGGVTALGSRPGPCPAPGVPSVSASRELPLSMGPGVCYSFFPASPAEVCNLSLVPLY